MLSPATIEYLDILHKTQNEYVPNPSIQVQLATKSLFAIVGPTCEGKNVVMDTAAKLDPRFKPVGAFTTRDPRDGDGNLYRYYKNTDGGLEGLLAEIAERKVVQYAINPHSHFIYGSRLSDYSTDFNLADSFSGAVAGFRQLGFKRVFAVSIVTEPETWLKRFDERFPMDHPDRTARRDEAIDSLTWSLAQPDDGTHFWIENVDGDPETAARALIAIADGTYVNPTHVAALAQDSLNSARHIPVQNPTEGQA